MDQVTCYYMSWCGGWVSPKEKKKDNCQLDLIPLFFIYLFRPVVGITAAVHGNELNGVPCIHR